MESQPPPVPARPVHEPDEVLSEDTPCRKCAYNLRGLSAAGRCPECGIPVGLSIRGDLIRFADPIWIDNVARGLTLSFWGMLFGVVEFNLTCGGFGSSVSRTFQVTGFLGGLVALYGAWLLTERDPSGIGEDDHGRVRKAIRVLLIIGLADSVLSQLLDAAVLDATLATLLGVIAPALGLFGAIGEFAKFWYLGKLADRIPDAKLVRRAKFVRWGFAVTLGLIGLFAMLAALVFPAPGNVGPPPVPLALVACSLIVAGMVALFFLVMALVLLRRMRTAFREQAVLARVAWSAADVGE